MSSALNVITASFGGLREVATSPLWQWDYGQILKIKGLDLPQAFEVHFSNSRKSGETVTQIGTDSQVVIPDMYLTSGADIYAFIFLHDGLTDGETEYVIKIPVRERPEPSDIEPTPVQQDVITEAIAALNEAVTQTGEDKEATAALAEAAAASSLIATEAAQSAQGSATAASASASTASTAAATATTKANEAATSATNAASAKTAAETAETNAQAAKTASENAQASAQSASQTATTKASEASTSATSASGSASAASASASQASESATQAAASATSASGSATAAAGSATTASTKASEASASATAAETAQGKAEDARDAAETTAQSISASAAQIATNTADITQLKSDLTNITDDIYEIVELSGKIEATGWRLVPSTGLCTSNSSYKLVKYPVTAGQKIRVVSDGYFQFQNKASVPSTGTSNRIGETYGQYSGYITVPENATYIIFSTQTNGSASASSVSNLIDTKKDAFEAPGFDLMNGRIRADGTYAGANGMMCTNFYPCNAGDRIQAHLYSFWYGGEPLMSLVAFYDINKNFISSITKFSETETNSTWGYLDVIAPEGTEYIRASTNSQKEENYCHVFTEDRDRTSVLDLNPKAYEYLLQAKRRNNPTNSAYLTAPQPVILLHFSDIHADATELSRMVKFKTAINSMIDDAICTGDLVEYRWANGIDYWTNTEGSDDILIAIGNHDVLTDPTGYDWSQRASEAEQYARYIEPFESNWGVQVSSGNTYYYKDYTAKGLRLVVLNCMLTGTDNADQLSWFSDVLSDANGNSLSVVVANHYMIATPQKINCNFSTLDKDVGSDVLPLEYLTAVNDFKINGGKFVCHIAGHTHWDLVVKSTTYPDQICIVIDALSRSRGNQYSDTQRTDGTRSQDLANLVSFDTASSVVKIIRVGANMDHYLRLKDCITINYTTGEIITQN